MKGQKVTLKITGTGMNGEGVARLDNLAVFIDGTLLGETVEAVIYEKKKNFARARVIKVLEKSESRREPSCPVYFRCGGCNLQHIDYAEQLNIKKRELESCLKKQLKQEIKVDDVVPSERALGYRNKLQIPIGELDGKVVAGFYKENTHKIIPVENCPLHGDWADRIIKAFIDYANENKISAYDEIKHKGLLRHLVARKINDKFSIVAVINGNSLPRTQDLIEKLASVINDNFSLFYSVNKDKTNVIMGGELHLVFGEERIEADILGLKVKVSPLSFMQVNDFIRDKIYRRVSEQIDGGTVVDAYSGAGVLTALAARRAERAIGIEIVSEAVRDADTLMKDNNLDHKVVNLCGDIKDILPEVVKGLGVCGHNSSSDDDITLDNYSGDHGSSASLQNHPEISLNGSDSAFDNFPSDKFENIGVNIEKKLTEIVINGVTTKILTVNFM